MKKSIFSIMLLLCFTACNTDLTEIEERLDQLEQESEDLKKEGEELKQEGEDLKKEGEELEKDIEDKNKELDDFLQGKNEPQLISFEFLASDNPMQLVENTACEIVGDSVVECWIANITSDKLLIPRFEFKGESLTIDGKKAESGVTIFDFKKPVTLTVTNAQQTKNYTIYVHSYTGLPVLWIETTNREDISVDNKYYNAAFKLVEDVKTRAPGDIIEASVKIKNVGEIKWYVSDVYPSQQIGKNSYAITFTKNISLLDEPQNNDWELFTNADDNTMLRNQTAFYMGKISNLSFTPRFHYVEMMLNGRYYGTYMLGDRLENNTYRINVGLNGYILKIEATTTGSHFSTNKLEQPVSIMAPSTLTGDNNYKYIADYLDATESALFGSNFTDVTEGWQKYLDMDSFVDWYLINEIAKNENGAFQADCYMHLKRGEKLKMGPLWKFEYAFANGWNSEPSGFVIKNTNWFKRLFEDPAFVEKVKERFTYFYAHKNDIINEINANGQYLKYSVRENDNKWGVFADYKSSNLDTWIIYQNEVSSMKRWLESRFEWLNGALQ